MADFVETAPDEGGPRVLELIGEVDSSTSDALVERAQHCLELSEALVLDLGGLTFIDSSGLGALVRIRNEATGQAKTLALTNVTDRTARLLRITGLDKSFDIQTQQP